MFVPYFLIDNIFIAPFDIQIAHIHQVAVELGSTDRGWRNSLKAGVLLVATVVILILMKNYFDFNSLVFYKYYVIFLSYILFTSHTFQMYTAHVHF
jgi:hypothetical protein